MDALQAIAAIIGQIEPEPATIDGVTYDVAAHRCVAICRLVGMLDLADDVGDLGDGIGWYIRAMELGEQPSDVEVDHETAMMVCRWLAAGNFLPLFSATQKR